MTYNHHEIMVLAVADDSVITEISLSFISDKSYFSNFKLVLFGDI